MSKSWTKISKSGEKNHTELLIKTVEKYPVLWDTSHPDYQNARQRELAWEQICATVIPDWITCKDKLHKCLDLKKKWTHVRDYYRKRLLAKLSFDSTGDETYRKRYVYEDLLHYMKPILLKLIDSREEGNCSNDDTTSEPVAYITLRESSPLPFPSLPSSSASLSPTPSPAPSSPAPSSPVRPVHKRFKSEPLNGDEASVSRAVNPLQLERNKAESHHSSQDEWNDDTKFLLSFRSYMRKMSDKQKVEFQIGMLKLVKKTFWEGS